MLLLETFRIAFTSIRANLFRSFLTMLGIIIGVGAVITMVALGKGAQQAIDEQMAALGGDILSVESSFWFQRGVSRERQTMTVDDYYALGSGMQHVSDAVPEMNGRFQIKYGNQNRNLNVLGTTPNYLPVHGFTLAAGRMFSDADEGARRLVAVLGAEIPAMFDLTSESIIGQTLSIRGIPFNVIGVLETKGSTGWRNPDNDIWIPFTTAKLRLMGRDSVDRISAKVAESSTSEQAMLEIERILRREHGIQPGVDNDFAIVNRRQFAESRQEATAIFAFLLAGIAGVSLLVGGIGIMNIMLVTVTERTREIGVRKALGATNSNILLQFLIESTTLCMIGGMLGLALGIGGASLLAQTAGWQTAVTVDSAMMAFGFSAAIGILFGIMPARRAAALDPIDALRHE
ncbi:MAG: ABC transporter permease [Pseudomonadota bacterium]